jgi:acetyl-CoA C-acetyltransferase
MRDVVIAGVGMHRFGRWGDKTDLTMGAEAIFEALEDANMEWNDIQAAACGKVRAGGAPGNLIWDQAGANGIPIVNVHNACATAGSALRLCYQWVAAGFYDVCCAVGIDKMPRHFITTITDEKDQDYWRWALVGAPNPGYWAMDCVSYMAKYGLTEETLVNIAVQNKKHGSLNPKAWYQKEVTREQVMKSPMVNYPLRQFMICTPDEGAAAAIVTTKEIAKKHTNRPLVNIAACELASKVYGAPQGDSVELSFNPVGNAPAVSTVAATRAYEKAGLGPKDLDVVELQDASAWNQIEYMEAIQLCPQGEAPKMIDSGNTTFGGKLPINTSGGLLCRGEPPGASQLAQIYEITLQVRGDAGPRQVEGAKVGLCHVYGGFGNSSVVILKR